MEYIKNYTYWLDNLTDSYKGEIVGISDEEIKSRFASRLSFGTAGLRGVLGIGLNRMNVFTVAQATQGLANHLIKTLQTDAGVVIAYDSRIMSEDFAKEAALVLAANKINVYLFDALRPTPELSFAVRHLRCAAGIVITASHNPAWYNGYKLYGCDGAQINLVTAQSILREIEQIDIFTGVKRVDFSVAVQDGFVEIVGRQVDAAYYNCILEQMLNSELVKRSGDKFSIIYTPLHGSGNIPLRSVLDLAGFKKVFVVPEQEFPDGNFSTVKVPNPEMKECFDYALQLANERDADLIIATDPDADRVGVMAKDEFGDYINFTGNQIGVLLTEYILSQTKNLKNGVVVKTIVSTGMIRKICDKYNFELLEVLTGFKFIGEKILEFEQNNEKKYVFGFEESYGYLKGTYARDKDAVAAGLLIAEMALYYKQNGMSLYNKLQNLYSEYGYFKEETISLAFDGIHGAEKIRSIMGEFRNNTPKVIAGMSVLSFNDLNYGMSGLPKADVLYFKLEGENNFVVRPSGTEPKIKFYLMFCGNDIESMQKKIDLGKDFIQTYV